MAWVPFSAGRWLAIGAALSFVFTAAAQQPGPDPCNPEIEECPPPGTPAGRSLGTRGQDGLRVSVRTLARAAEEEDEAEHNSGADPFVQRWVAQALGTAAPPEFGAWISYARSSYRGSGTTAPYKADLDAVLLGFDRLLADGGTLGLALIIEHRRTDTVDDGGREESDGFGLAAFGVLPLNRSTSIDWTAGYTGIASELQRPDPVNGSPLRGGYDSARWFAATNVVGLHALGSAWLASGRLSLVYATERFDRYAEAGGPARGVDARRVDLLQGAFACELAYTLPSIEPYTFIGYRYDFDRGDDAAAGAAPADRTEGETGIGLRWFGRSLSISGEWLHTFAREDFDNETLSLLVRSEF